MQPFATSSSRFLMQLSLVSPSTGVEDRSYRPPGEWPTPPFSWSVRCLHVHVDIISSKNLARNKRRALPDSALILRRAYTLLPLWWVSNGCPIINYMYMYFSYELNYIYTDGQLDCQTLSIQKTRVCIKDTIIQLLCVNTALNFDQHPSKAKYK